MSSWSLLLLEPKLSVIDGESCMCILENQALHMAESSKTSMSFEASHIYLRHAGLAGPESEVLRLYAGMQRMRWKRYLRPLHISRGLEKCLYTRFARSVAPFEWPALTGWMVILPYLVRISRYSSRCWSILLAYEDDVLGSLWKVGI